jgi:MFS family permease
MYQRGEKIRDVRFRLRNKPTSDRDPDNGQPFVGTGIAEDDEKSTSSSLGEILILVFPLLLIYVSNQWSRYSISYLVDFSSSTDASTSAVSAFEAMNVDLQFTQSQYGLLASTAFTILFALSSLLAGTLADRYNRKLLTLVPASIWTLATLWTSQSQSYNDVLMARIVMGGACAFAVPAAYSLIADSVSKDKLALSNSLFGSGVYLGGALASLSLLLDKGLGWRGTMSFIGGFGAVSIAAVGLLLPSDGNRDGKYRLKEELVLADRRDRMKSEVEEDGLVQNTLRILSIPRVRFIFLASFFRFCSGLMIGVWAAPYYKQTFPDNVSEYAVVNALIVGAMGMSSGILGGYIADGLSTWFRETKEGDAATSIIHDYFDEQTIRLLLPICGSLLAIPAWYLTTHTTSSTNSFEIAMAWLAIGGYYC